MESILNIELYFISAMLLVMTPGVDTVLVLNKSIAQHRSAGVFAALGVSMGIFVHVFFAAVGLSLLIAQSATAFLVLKYLGAAYLIYLGLQKFRIHQTMALGTQKADENKAQPNRAHFVAGFVTNVLNPKVALFFLAFLPQFIAPTAVGELMPYVILGAIYVCLTIVWLTSLACFSAIFATGLQNNSTFNRWIDRISGSVFILMGIKVALSKNPTT